MSERIGCIFPECTAYNTFNGSINEVEGFGWKYTYHGWFCPRHLRLLLAIKSVLS